MKLEIRSLAKTYRDGTRALAGVDLELGPGVVGLLGPNGAGKTTLMNILATLTRPSEGQVLWNGEDIARRPEAVRAELGYLPQEFGVYPHLTAREFLEYLAAVKGLSAAPARRRIAELLELVNLAAVGRRLLGGYSGGMKQRLGIAQALLNDPKLLIVDEPTVGLDPEERVRFRHLVADLSGERLVILSTHIVSDVEMAATEIALLAGGRLLGHAPPESWLARVDGKVWEWVVPSAELPAARARFAVSGALRQADGVHLRVVSAEPPAADARPLRPNLEDAYILSVGRAA